MITLECCNAGIRPGPDHGWAILWGFVHAFAAFVLLVATLASFNRCLGRVETGLFWSGDRLLASPGCT